MPVSRTNGKLQPSGQAHGGDDETDNFGGDDGDHDDDDGVVSSLNDSAEQCFRMMSKGPQARGPGAQGRKRVPH